MPKSYEKQQLYFDISDSIQSESYDFLCLCGHKTTKYLSFIIHRFLEANHVRIEDCTQDDIKKLMEYLSSPIGKNAGDASGLNQKYNTQYESGEKDKGEDIDDMRDALAAFS